MAATSNYTVSASAYTLVATGVNEVLVEVSDQGKGAYVAVSSSQPAAGFIGHEVQAGAVAPIATPGNSVWARSSDPSSSAIIVVTE